VSSTTKRCKPYIEFSDKNLSRIIKLIRDRGALSTMAEVPDEESLPAGIFKRKIWKYKKVSEETS
jgi:hypothetical protein